MQIFPEKHSAERLYGLFVCTIIVFLMVMITEMISPSDTKIKVSMINSEIPVVIENRHPTSTRPIRFDPLTRGIASSTPQFVLLSFDGSKSIEMWRETNRFAKEMNSSNIPAHFTYFINSAYLLGEENKNVYLPVSGEVGHSAIGYAESLKSINDRVREINLAFDDGHEIGSHTAGHWLGGSWSVEDWLKEFSSFADLLFNYKKNNPQYKFTENLKLQKSDIKGFRAPSLSINENMYKALSKDGFYYDSSEINTHNLWPSRDAGGVWHIPISVVYYKNIGMPVIAVDYSVWINQTKGENIFVRGTKLWESEVQSMINDYIKNFEKNYYSNRAPIVIDNHFSTWNDGLYWEAMKGFAVSVCGRPQVKCSTFSDLVHYMESQ